MASIEHNTFSRLLRISSEHSLNDSDTCTNFSINLSRMLETNNVVRAVVKNVDFPNNFYNITELNNEFSLEFSTDGILSITPLQPGFYSTNDIIAYIASDINGQLSTGVLTITKEAITDKIKFEMTLQTVKIYSSDDLVDNSLSKNLGISETTALGSSHVANKIPMLAGVTSLYIHSQELADGHLVDGDVEQHPILAHIPVDKVWGAHVYYNSADDELDSINYKSPRNLDYIKIQVKDLYDNILELQGGEFNITLKLYYLN